MPAVHWTYRYGALSATELVGTITASGTCVGPSATRMTVRRALARDTARDTARYRAGGLLVALARGRGAGARRARGRGAGARRARRSNHVFEKWQQCRTVCMCVCMCLERHFARTNVLMYPMTRVTMTIKFAMV